MDLERVFRFVSPSVKEAVLQGAARLEGLGVRYALIGGLAVGAYGYIRATVDVDFLVGDEAFVHYGVLVTFRPGIPIEVGGIRTDYLSPAGAGPQLEQRFKQVIVSQGVAVAPAEILIYLKLVAKQRKDLLVLFEQLVEEAIAA